MSDENNQIDEVENDGWEKFSHILGNGLMSILAVLGKKEDIFIQVRLILIGRLTCVMVEMQKKGRWQTAFQMNHIIFFLVNSDLKNQHQRQIVNEIHDSINPIRVEFHAFRKRFTETGG